jgi:hypothetical protein
MRRTILDTMRDNASEWKQSPLVKLREAGALTEVLCMQSERWLNVCRRLDNVARNATPIEFMKELDEVIAEAQTIVSEA